MLKLRMELAITAVAERTGLSAAALRAWEMRYGFPKPHRLIGGHRRYTERQVDQILEVIRLRDGGLSLAAAIREVSQPVEKGAPSMYAEVRRRWADQPVHVLTTRAMHAISRAIEDESCAHADRPVLIGSFQSELFYRRSESRWRELARTATSATVFADFASSVDRPGSPKEIAVPIDAALRREWAVVCDGQHSAACLLGVERPDPIGTRARTFEALWSVDPDVVRDAAEIGAALAGHRSARLAPLRRPADADATLRRATAIANRAIAYLDR